MKIDAMTKAIAGTACSTLMFACLATAVASAQTLEKQVEDALRNNPGLKAKGLEHQAARERIRRASSPPDPQLSLGLYLEPMERYMGDQVLTATLMQMFPWFGTLGAARDEAAAMAAMKGEAFRETRNRLVFEVRENWYSLHLKREELRVAEENLEILRTLESIALNRFGSGGGGGAGSGDGEKGGTRQQTAASPSGSPVAGGATGSGGMGGMSPPPPQGGSMAGSGSAAMSGGSMSGGAMGGAGGGSGLVDVLLVRMEVAELEDRMVSLREDLGVASVRASRLLAGSPGQTVVLVDTLDVLASPAFAASTETADAALANNPMLKMLEFEERAYEFQGKMSSRMGLPMFGVGLQYEYLRERHDAAGHAMGGSMLMPMVSVSLPIWRGKYSGAVREAARMREATVESRTDARLELRMRLVEARRELDGASRRISLYAAQSERTQMILNILMSRYAMGDENIEEVLRIRQTLLDYRLRHLRAIVENNTAVAMLEWLIGGE